MDETELIAARDQLLEAAIGFFSADPAVVGVFVSGSLAAGSADAWSDIDLRVVVTADRHRYFVDQRREVPKQWPGFLFNEWVPGAQHCVSHFRPFGKIDIFYYDAAAMHLRNPLRWVGEIALADGHRRFRDNGCPIFPLLTISFGVVRPAQHRVPFLCAREVEGRLSYMLHGKLLLSQKSPQTPRQLACHLLQGNLFGDGRGSTQLRRAGIMVREPDPEECRV